MTEAFGARMLKELHTESLSELIASLSASLPFDQNPTVPRIPFLKDLLVPPQSVLSATSVQDEGLLTGIPSILSSPSPPFSPPLIEAQALNSCELKYLKPPIIEIISATTNTSRTVLINCLLASLLLTQHGQPMSLVVYFDCAYKLSLSDLQACLLKSCDQDEVIGLEAVSRLHVIRPDSSRQLLNQLRNVESYILSLPSKDVVLSAVILSDLSVFYWSERWSEEEARFQDSTTTEGKAYSRESLHTMILTEVGRLQKMFQCVVVVSGLGVTSDRVSPIRTGLAGPWIKAVDIRIVLKRSINDRMEGEIDGRKWVAACGGDSRIGEAKCEIQVSVDGLELVQLHHGI